MYIETLNLKVGCKVGAVFVSTPLRFQSALLIAVRRNFTEIFVKYFVHGTACRAV